MPLRDKSKGAAGVEENNLSWQLIPRLQWVITNKDNITKEIAKLHFFQFSRSRLWKKSHFLLLTTFNVHINIIVIKTHLQFTIER